ncbi:MAG: cyclic nucleotide-binding domain-containing protein [Chloroflexi bacterium]|nr:MAG: cyclic nucleotide-binding domain-containing protein [Chloroflexota bacterium]
MVSPEILKRFPLCAGLDEEALRRLAAIAEEVSFPRGTLIFAEGEPADALYLLLDGWVDILINLDASGDRRGPVMILSPGELFGWSALVEPYIYTASALCAGPVSAIKFPGSALRRLCETDPRLGWVLITRVSRVIVSRLRATRAQVVGLLVTG